MKSPEEIQTTFQDAHDNLVEALGETKGLPKLEFGVFSSLLAIELLAFRLGIDLHQDPKKVPATVIEPGIQTILDKKGLGVTAKEEHDLAVFRNNRTSQLG